MFRNSSKLPFNIFKQLRYRIPQRVQSVQTISSKFFQINSPVLSRYFGNGVLALSVLAWLGFEDDDEEKESELIMTLKRAVLCTRREQYDTAEQMLHLALRMSQQQHNRQAILYCYDLMANLALDTQQLDKAEKLFVSVMQMLLANGAREDDIKMIHLSLKMARIYHLRADGEKAEIGYQWCLNKIAAHNSTTDGKLLTGVIHDWYAQLLLDRGATKDAVHHLREAYQACCDSAGSDTEQAMVLLNDLAIASWRADDLGAAFEFLRQAKSIGAKLNDQTLTGVISANMGLLYLEQGFKDIAEQTCKEALKLGNRHQHDPSIEQAKYCFDQIKVAMEKNAMK